MTEAALKQAENELNEAAAQVQAQFKQLENAVLANRSVGDAFVAAQKVAGELRDQATKFQRMTEELAANVGLSSKNYMQNNEAGAQAIGAVSGMIGDGATFSRLTPS